MYTETTQGNAQEAFPDRQACVLVVEDEELAAESIRITLEEFGYEIPAVAATGADALVKTGTFGPDLVLMDIGLAGPMDGIEAAARIQSQFEIPVVYLSAHADIDLLERAKQTGPYGYILKPFKRLELHAALQTALARREQEILDRERAEKRLQRRNALLDGINRILKEGLTCKEDQEIALLCLRVCEELTGSRFGFIVERNAAGLADTLAISHPGWDACGMPHSEAMARTKNMEIRGIDRSVLREGKSRIVNNPASHPDRVGTPEGHPPLTAFLGVPLKWSEQTIGMIGLANKEGGYSPADQADIEAVSQAFVQALDRKRAEMRLVESEQRFRTMADVTHDWEYWIGPDGRFVSISPSCKRVTGYTPEAFEKDPALLYRIVHPDDPRCTGGDMGGGQETGECSVDFRIITRNGQERWIAHRCRPVFGSDGTYLGRRASNSDITDRKRTEQALRESEEKYRILVENSNDALIVLQNGRIRFHNKRLEEITGRSPERLNGAGLLELVAPEDTQCTLDTYLEIHRQGRKGPPRAYALRLEDEVGNQRYTDVTAVPITWDGSPAVLYIVKDVDRQRTLEHQLRQAQKMEAIGTLAGGIAHDFNNILAAITGYTELALQDTRDHKPLQATLEQVLQAGLRAKQLVKQILTFSRQVEQERTPAEVSLLVKEALGLIRAGLPATIEIRQNLRARSSLVLVDPTQIHQVLMNLCTNAKDAMAETGGVLEVSLTEEELDSKAANLHPDLKPGPYIKLAVSDTGCGMEQPILDRIFDPFFTTKGPGRGTGMGLAVVHGIVGNHGGAIRASSEPGSGTTFEVYLPRITEEATIGDVHTHASASPSRRQARILLVEDEPPLVELYRQMLGRAGHQITARTNGLDALVAFRDRPEYFDLVITDMTMPNLTGLELAREIKQVQPEIPILLCTGFSHLITAQKAKDAGILQVLMKPVRVADLIEAINKALDKAKDERGPQNVTILVIDDEEPVRQLLQQMLEREGYRVLKAGDGKEALRVHENQPADLVITDIFMPEADGLETIRALRRSHPNVKIIAMSGGARAFQGSYLDHAKAFGANRVFPKPLPREELLKAVHELTGIESASP